MMMAMTMLNIMNTTTTMNAAKYNNAHSGETCRQEPRQCAQLASWSRLLQLTKGRVCHGIPACAAAPKGKREVFTSDHVRPR